MGYIVSATVAWVTQKDKTLSQIASTQEYKIWSNLNLWSLKMAIE